MGGRTLDQFRSIQRSKAKKSKETDANKNSGREESKENYSTANPRD
ncbi:hypothetical protein SRRS_53660 [Sporomusa rhizae]